MNRKKQLILHGITLFVTMIILLVVTGLFILKSTVLSKNYVINLIKNNEYYQVIYDNIKDEMLYYIPQSGFSNDIIDDTFTLDEVTKDVNNVIKNVYSGKKSQIDSSIFEERLNTKIDNYVVDNNFVITNKDELFKFTDEMAKIYVNKITISGYANKIASYVIKIIKIINVIFIISILLLIAILLFNLKFFKFRQMGSVLFNNTLLLIILNIWIKNVIPINNIFIYNDIISMIIKDIVLGILSYMIILGIIYLILGIILVLITNREKKK